MKKFPLRSLAFAMVLPIFVSAGCAWQGDLDSLRNEVSNLQSNMEKANADSASNTKQALDTAAAAARTSEQAAKEALRATELSQQAVEAAQAANTKVARIFEEPKTVVYVLQFETNKSRINHAMGRKLDEILSEWKGKAAAFQVVGHTDMVGSKKANLLLSKKRADEVKAGLVRRGVSKSIVSTVGVGQNALTVQTASGVPSRVNRRVVLKILPKDS